MNAYDLIKEKVAYNQWANRKVIDWLKEQSADLYEQKVMTSFPTINKLIHHLMEAEKYYFSILRQQEETYPEEIPTKKLFDDLLQIDQNLLDWVSQLEPGELEKIISLKRSPFIEQYTTATIITHMVNHSTYHRGQLVALRHQLQLSTAPRTDYYRYIIAQQA